MGGKRGNETAQLSKEELAAEQASRRGFLGGGSLEFQRASEEEMAKRRMARGRMARGRSPGGNDGDTAAAANTNPFAKVSFASSVTQTPAAKTTSTAFSFGGTAATTTSSSSSSTRPFIPTPAGPKTTGEDAGNSAAPSRLPELGTKFNAHVRTLPVHGAEWTKSFTQYIEYRGALPDPSPATNAPAMWTRVAPTTSTPSTTSTATTNPAPGGFSFGSTAPTETTSPAPGGLFGSTAAPTATSGAFRPNFTFPSSTSTASPAASPTAATAPTTSFPFAGSSAGATPTLSFAGTSAVSSAPTAASPAVAPVAASPAPFSFATRPPAPAAKQDEDTAKEQDSKDDATAPTQAMADPHSDAKVHYEVDVARYFKFDREKGNFVSGAKGHLKLEYSKAGKRIVIRDPQSGNVLFVVALPKEITMAEQNTKNGAKKYFIQFFAVLDEQEDNEPVAVRLHTKEAVRSELYEKIRQLGVMKV